ncbi:MAG: sigma-54 dependent transcriptional regulator [Bacteroidales bacterium]|jgi:transcriptional regulator with PAS, ATPase and Fis domain|nr:sigma-54 dependent transcriptional regulator [Bacteroidales bacterium]
MNIQEIKQKFGIIGNSEGLNRAIDIATQVAPTDISVLITGESGVGKEKIPQIIHSLSKRKLNTYIAVNCGAIPEGTIDSELFGHIKGSFTSANSDRKGYFEETNNGTIFLDEVAELPLSTQVRLLRVLESGEYMKVGSSKIEKTNVRIIAATNENFTNSISSGKFREDLYYRLNTVPIHLPPLRERKQDIFLLFRKFAADFAENYKMPAIKLTEDAIPLLENYYWSGNIRQLKNITEQISIIEEKRIITPEILRKYLVENIVQKLPALAKNNNYQDFASEREILYKILFDLKKDVNDLKFLVNNIINKDEISKHSDSEPKIFQTNLENISFENISNFHSTKTRVPIENTDDIAEEVLSLAEQEKDSISKSLDRNNNNRKLASKELGISERTLYRKIKEYNLIR